ncbi:50S ribosomal protein L17 [Luteolibacter yonseiensis]|uniref:Large ribosomal subunit protein bL17 n=1 Tax=Luteolibacter yonseiensis TaxID=1144680 RepID=A0A934VAX7_9BACT|nr:50S ribosomal protein L17 [Luteolibacter yonseiensis]
MRHRSKTVKLKRNASQRRALLANLACSLIQHGRIKTTLGKAKALRPVAEKLITLAKRDDLHSRRLAISFLRQKDTVQKLFSETAPASKDRQGGYCRITKLGARMSDSAPMAIIEWVDAPASEEPVAEVAVAEEAAPAEAPAKPAKKAAKKKKAAEEVVEVAGE